MPREITTIAKDFAAIRAKHAEMSAHLKELDTEWNAIETELLEAMVEEGIRSVDIDGLGKFSMAVTNYLSVNAANKEIFYPYLKESGNGALLKEDVNPRTLTAFLRDHLESIIKENESRGMDVVDARNEALKFLNEKGASYFTKREVRMTKK